MAMPPLRQVLVFVSAGVMFCVLVLIVVSMAGVDVPWTKYDRGGLEVNFALLEQESDAGSGTVKKKYSSSDELYYDDCNHAGKATLAFSVLALITAALSTLTLIRQARASQGGRKLLAFLAPGLTAVFILVAFSVWSGACHKQIQDTPLPGTRDGDYRLAAGFALSVTGFILTVASLIMVFVGTLPEQ